jgi:hypothetical protein
MGNLRTERSKIKNCQGGFRAICLFSLRFQSRDRHGPEPAWGGSSISGGSRRFTNVTRSCPKPICIHDGKSLNLLTR